ncbi:MAG: 30S ribosomal protein S17 [Candidatus Saccharimonadales bacterium]|jgi:small subunit ribosomal protein S17
MPKKITGIVTSDVQDKTIVITVTSRQTHPIYGKQYTVSRKYTAHDEKNEAHIGDRVEVSESRPYSKTKTWKLERIVESGHGLVELKDEEEVVAKKAVATEKEVSA